jgi:beta-galactosidase/beta-glucuronidase
MKIEELTVQQKRLSPAEAELWVHVRVAAIGPTTQIRGSLTGPLCQSVQTIQIAYPVRCIKPPGHSDNEIIGRVLIPEPNLWSAETPFVYEGNVELWDEGKLVDLKPIRAAFKLTTA